jgi:hypothetical protein
MASQCLCSLVRIVKWDSGTSASPMRSGDPARALGKLSSFHRSREIQDPQFERMGGGLGPAYELKTERSITMIGEGVRYGFTMKNRATQRDSAATLDKDGNVSNSRLHEQMTEGVDDYDFRMETRAKLLAQGVPISALDRVLPVSPPEAMGARCDFDKRVMEHLLPQFCRHYGYDIAGFHSQTLNRISEYDALWFMRALDANVVRPDGAFFNAVHNGAKEQIFWQYGKPGSSRQISLWVEPVISIGAAGRLHCQFGWPKDRIGLQSEKNWAFDLVAYDDATGTKPLVYCEVKKSKSEIDYLIKAMLENFPQPTLSEGPTVPIDRGGKGSRDFS